MTLDQLDIRVREFSARCAIFDQFAWVTAMTWPGRWLVTCAYLNLRGEGTTAQEAFEAFDKAMTAYEEKDQNLARTLGIEIEAA